MLGDNVPEVNIGNVPEWTMSAIGLNATDELLTGNNVHIKIIFIF